MYRSIRWQIAVPYLILVTLSILLFGFITANQVYQRQLDQLEIHANQQMSYLAGLITTVSHNASLEELNRLLHTSLPAGIENRYEFMPQGERSNGQTELFSDLNNPLEAPEITQALAGTPASNIRTNPLDGEKWLFVAVPVRSDGEQIGILQGAFSLASLANMTRQIQIATVVTALLAAIITVIVSGILSAWTFRPLRELTYTAREIADASRRSMQRTDSDEFSQLTLAFNSMSLELQSQIEALKEERGRLATVLQQMTDAVVIADELGRVQLFNRAAEKLFLISAENAMGRSLVEVLRDHRLVDLWEKCRQSGVEESIYLEFRQLNLALQCIATPMESSEPGHILLLFQNLTHVRRLETIRRDFISNISHELRTPLASLKALAETLQDGALEDPPAARRFLNRMETEVDALSHMVSELLELSRIESGKVPLQLSPISPCDLLKPAFDRASLQAERNHLQMHFDCDQTLPAVMADAPRIQQVIANLLQNAIKFTPAGGEITLQAYEQNDSITFAVKDTGVGIPSEDLERIFERFFKADRARSSGGTGLGLAISRHLVEAHGGKIWAESIETRGSTFNFTLPKA